MDIEKICRTCLALSGPLLSIFDGSGDGLGSGCLADMLYDFTKMKPKPMDNMPEKVCLTCISEINRCYSFKMKCENANKTLLQLLPDAVDAMELELEQTKVEQQRKLVHKEVQTTPEEPKQMQSRPVQTIDEPQIEHIHQEVQTEILTNNAATSLPPLSSKLKNTENSTTVKIEKAVDLGEYEFSHSNTTLEDKKNIRKLKFKQLQLEDEQAQNDGEIIYELQSESGNENNSSDCEMEILNQTELDDSPEDSTAYYVLSSSQPDEEYFANVEYECEDNNASMSSSNGHDQESKYSKKKDYNFTIVQTEQGKEEITETTETTQSQEIHLQSKMRISVGKAEVRCEICTMPFVNIKNLLRHCINTHQWTEKETKNYQYALQQEQQQQQNSVVEGQTLDIVLDENMHASILQELKAEVVIEKVEEKVNKQKQIHSIKTEHPLRAFCPRCNAGFAFTKALNYHLKQNQCTVMAFSCDECQRVFNTEHGLEEHRETHLKQLSCTDCNLMFIDKNELCQHLIKMHNRSDKNQCHICNKVFTMTSALKDHLRIHSGEKPYKCTMCDKSFCQNSNLKQHVMRHSQIKPFSCETCSLTYVSKAELLSHQRTHTGDHPFKCSFCDACYTTSSSLVKHKRKHTGERPYACEFCPMRFSSLNVMKNHRRTHTGEKPYVCRFCNKCFTQKSDCQIHERTHTGEKRYTCACGNSFTHLSTLRLHQKVHEGEDTQGGTEKKRRKGPPRSVRCNNLPSMGCKIKEQLETDGDTMDEVQQNEHETLVINDATADDEFMELAINDMV